MDRFGTRFADTTAFLRRSPIKGGDRSSISISYATFIDPLCTRHPLLDFFHFFNVQTGFLEQHTVRNFRQGLFVAEAFTVSRNISEFLPEVVTGRSVCSQQEHIRAFARGCCWPKRVRAISSNICLPGKESLWYICMSGNIG